MHPIRRDYKLNAEGQEVYEEFLSKDYTGCTCHTGHPPCSYCTDPGNPIAIEETDDYWEEDEEYEKDDEFFMRF